MLTAAGAAEVLVGGEVTAERLHALLAALLPDRERLAQMARAARGLARPRAAARHRRPSRAVGGGRAVSFIPFTDLTRIHFVGIGGAGMSGIAEILLQPELRPRDLRLRPRRRAP